MATTKKKIRKTAPRAKKTLPIKKINRVQTFLAPEHIAERAYSLWQQEGCQHGRDVQYWLEAENQLRGEIGAAR